MRRTLHTPRTIKLAKAGLALALLLATATALAAEVPVKNPAVFELENNALDSADIAGDDWESVAGTGNSATEADFFIDKFNDGSDNNFATGGSKDERDISASGITKTYWGVTDTTPPDKDDLEHAYAAAYSIDPDGSGSKPAELVIYFGADRFSNSGDAALGFWFFKNSITDTASGFVGKHAIGDVLVTSDFRQGGSASVINVFTWNGNAGNPLTLVASSANSPSNVDPDSKVFCLNSGFVCAVANPTPVDVPSSWGGYSFKGAGAVTSFPQGTFFEGGVNISALFPNTGPCFASFMAMTRTSASTTAQLKDYVLGSFPLCSMRVTKSCPSTATINSDGSTVKSIWSVPVTNTGSGTLYNVAITEETLPGAFNATCKVTSPTIASPDLTNNVPKAVFASLAAGATSTATIECNSTSTNLVNGVSASASSSSVAGATRDVTAPLYTASADRNELCPVTPPAGITVTKECAKSTGAPNGVKLIVGGGFQVCVNISVTNDSAESLRSVSVVDSDVGTLLTGGTMTPGQKLTYNNKCYVAASADGNETNPGNASFSDRVDVSGVTVLSNQTVGDPALPEATATCKLCPTCPTCP